MPSSTAPASLPSTPDIIEGASEETLRNMLHALCAADSKNYERIQKFHQDMQAVARRTSNNKRRAESVIAVCIVCEKVFDEADNHDTACQTHDGEREADDQHEAWNDMDGYHDYEEIFNEWPEAFIMDCCGQRGDSTGCQVQRHTTRYNRQSSQERDQNERSELLPIPLSGAPTPSVSPNTELPPINPVEGYNSGTTAALSNIRSMMTVAQLSGMDPPSTVRDTSELPVVDLTKNI